MPNAREVVLAHPVNAAPVAADFAVVERARGDPGEGELLVRPAYLSLDPYIGGRLRGRHMGEPAPAPGEALPGVSVGVVVASRASGFAEGDLVVGECGWTDLGVMKAAAARKVDGAHPLSAYLGVLGVAGLTAWAGVCELAKVREGDVFTVDAAAGPVGGTAGQIARILGAKAVGVAGGPEKCALVRNHYGFDAAVDYHAPDWRDAFKAATAPGPTVHFENVGTEVLMPAMAALQTYGRVVLCGLAAHYHEDAPAMMPVGLIVGKRAAMLGLVVYDFYARFDEWIALGGGWLKDGRLTIAEDIGEGLASAPAQFERLMRGQNVGKTLVKL